MTTGKRRTFKEHIHKRALIQWEEFPRSQGGCQETNISYYSPAFFRYFAHLSGNDMWMQLADDWVPPEQSYPEAKAAAQKAIALDESLAEAHTALGKVYGWFEWDFDRIIVGHGQVIETGGKETARQMFQNFGYL